MGRERCRWMSNVLASLAQWRLDGNSGFASSCSSCLCHCQSKLPGCTPDEARRSLCFDYFVNSDFSAILASSDAVLSIRLLGPGFDTLRRIIHVHGELPEPAYPLVPCIIRQGDEATGPDLVLLSLRTNESPQPESGESGRRRSRPATNGLFPASRSLPRQGTQALTFPFQHSSLA